MKLKTTYYLVQAVYIALYLLSIAIGLCFFYETYLLVRVNWPMLELMKDFHYAQEHIDQLIELFYQWVNIGIKYFIIYAVVKIVGYVFRRLIIPAKCTAYWQNNGEIGPILGRYLVGHYRDSRYLQVRKFSDIVEIAGDEERVVAHHAGTGKLSSLFKAHDVFWKRDNAE